MWFSVFSFVCFIGTLHVIHTSQNKNAHEIQEIIEGWNPYECFCKKQLFSVWMIEFSILHVFVCHSSTIVTNFYSWVTCWTLNFCNCTLFPLAVYMFFPSSFKILKNDNIDAAQIINALKQVRSRRQTTSLREVLTVDACSNPVIISPTTIDHNCNCNIFQPWTHKSKTHFCNIAFI